MRAARLRDLVRVGPSPIHGRGLFARQKIEPDMLIGEYEGPETRRDSKYVLWVEDGEETTARRGVGPLKYLNHSKEPNAYFDGFELYALVEIAAGEEITFDYGEDWP